MRSCGKCGTAGQPTDDMAHTHCILDIYNYRHIFVIDMQYLLLFSDNKWYLIAPQCYVKRTLAVVLL
jgi:hypothetical protein